MEQYETVSAQTEYSDFSHEELRLADYAQGNRHIIFFSNRVLRSDCGRGKGHLELYVPVCSSSAYAKMKGSVVPASKYVLVNLHLRLVMMKPMLLRATPGLFQRG
jgi:hypothetical protein